MDGVLPRCFGVSPKSCFSRMAIGDRSCSISVRDIHTAVQLQLTVLRAEPGQEASVPAECLCLTCCLLVLGRQMGNAIQFQNRQVISP